MKPINAFLIATVVSSSLLMSAAWGHSAGDTIVRVGPAMVDPQDDSSTLSINGVNFPGTSVSVDDNTQLGLTLTYMLNEHLGIGLLAATPFKHTVTAHGLGADLTVADVKHLPPTLSVEYFPMSANSPFQPYAGLGLNYTTFFSEDLDSEFINFLGDGDIELDDSVGLAVEVGFDYAISNTLSLNATVWKADIETTANIDLDNGLAIETDVDIDPLVYMVGLGLRF